MSNLKNTLIQITRQGMGSDDELGQTLIANYLRLLGEEEELPRFIAFYHGGVKLICNGSSVLTELRKLEERGVKLMACKTCLNYFDLAEQVEIGVQATMIDILELQKVADKVITV